MTQQIGDMVPANEVPPPIEALALASGKSVPLPSAAFAGGEEACSTCGCPLPGIEIASWWLTARRLREAVFGAEMFSDPAWDILLCLYVVAGQGEKVKITSLNPMTGLPITTAGRWARKLVASGLLARERDDGDKRRSFISLSPQGYELVKRYFEELILKGKLPGLQEG